MRWGDYDAYDELCEYYAKRYHHRVEPYLRQFVNEHEFIREFSRSIISQDIIDPCEFEREAKLIYNKLLYMNIC